MKTPTVMNRKNLILSCFLLFLLSCSNKDIEQEFEDPLITLSNEELKVLSIRGTKTTKDFSEIESDIQFVINFLDKDVMTRSSQRRTVNNIKALTSESDNSSTRSFTSNDTLIYAVNFDNNMGAALICADKRVNEPILAFFPEGSISESIDNPGLSIFLANAEADILNSIENFENKKDSIYLEILSKYGDNNKLTRSSIDDNYDYEGKIEIHTITKRWPLVLSGGIAPLVNAQWQQGSPFNENIKYKGCSEGKAPAGCGPIAIAQIMSYWKHPSTFHGVNFDWNNINNYPTPFQMSQAPIAVRQNVAKLIEEVAKSLETKYSCKEGSTNTKQYEKILKEAGFKFNSKQKYNSTTVYKSLGEKKPLLIRGSSGRKKFLGIFTYKYTGGHIWIIDGELTMSEKFDYTVTRVSETDGAIVSMYNGTSTSYYSYLHLNWGWGGSNNGYFSASYFNANDKPSFNSGILTRNVSEDDVFDGEYDSSFDEGTSGNFVYEIEIIPFISK